MLKLAYYTDIVLHILSTSLFLIKATCWRYYRQDGNVTVLYEESNTFRKRKRKNELKRSSAQRDRESIRECKRLRTKMVEIQRDAERARDEGKVEMRRERERERKRESEREKER